MCTSARPMLKYSLQTPPISFRFFWTAGAPRGRHEVVARLSDLRRLLRGGTLRHRPLPRRAVDERRPREVARSDCIRTLRPEALECLASQLGASMAFLLALLDRRLENL